MEININVQVQIKMSFVVIFCCIFLSLASRGTFEKTLPNYITLCSRKSPNLSQCFKKAMQDLKPHLLKGIPEMDSPPLAPLILTSIPIKLQNSSAASFDAVLNRDEINGLEEYEVLDARLDLISLNMIQKIRIPQLKCLSNFTAKGKILLFSFDGNGIMDLKIRDIVMTIEWQGEKYIKNGKEHLKFRPIRRLMTAVSFSMDIKGLFKQRPDLDKALNQALTDNSDELRPDFEPLAANAIFNIINRYQDTVFSLFSFDQLFPPY